MHALYDAISSHKILKRHVLKYRGLMKTMFYFKDFLNETIFLFQLLSMWHNTVWHPCHCIDLCYGASSFSYHCFCTNSANVSNSEKGKECLNVVTKKCQLHWSLEVSWGPPLRIAALGFHFSPLCFFLITTSKSCPQRIIMSID